ncbi:hypothetical protein R5R35_013143 [Gryllus longicercus]|uniref:C-type lectin domain-containing protein n=1 Tax=Gryllus longicercus TaxID=2509291 RepID=A0AAN9ZAH5_9ORTH
METEKLLWKLLFIQLLQAFECTSSNLVQLNVLLSSQHNATQHRLMSAKLQSVGAKDQEVYLDVSLWEAKRPEGTYLLTLGAETAVKVQQRFMDYHSLADLPGLYKLHRRAATWPEANSACISEGAQLLVPDSAKEALAAIKLLMGQPPPPGVDRSTYLFVGITDSVQEGSYVSVTGKSLSELGFNTWSPGQPDKGDHSNWVAIYTDGKYHDIPNTWKLSFMCKAPQ